jgi:hypothetical protein
MADLFLEFIAHTGESGSAWVQQYQRYCHILRLINGAMSPLRSQQLKAADQILQRAARAMEDADIPDSIRAVLEQGFHKVSGLCYYRKGDLANASQEMRLAHCAVARAIEIGEFLIPFALQCPDLCLNQARVARNQRNWDEMHTHIGRMHAMLADKIPLCERSRGPGVYYSTLRDIFLSIRTPGNAAFDELCILMEEDRRLPFYDRIIRSFFRFESAAIDYAPELPDL